VGKGKLFWFFSVGFERWQKPNVLDRVVAFQLAGNGRSYTKCAKPHPQQTTHYFYFVLKNTKKTPTLPGTFCVADVARCALSTPIALCFFLSFIFLKLRKNASFSSLIYLPSQKSCFGVACDLRIKSFQNLPTQFVQHLSILRNLF